jgi:gliding motility-associated-like protein
LSAGTEKQRKEITVTITSFPIKKPAINISSKTDPTCIALGSVTLSSDVTDDSYKVRYGSSMFALNHKYDLMAPGLYQFQVVNSIGCVVDTVKVTLAEPNCKIQFNRLDITQECNTIRRGNIKVITNAHLDSYTYILDGKISKTTGVFDQLKTGTYTIKIQSAFDEKTVTATIPNYTQTDPVVSFVKNDHSCAIKGDIQFSIPVDAKDYTVKFNGSTYPLTNKFTELDSGRYHFALFKPSGCVLDSVTVDVAYLPCPIEIASLKVEQECDILGKGVITVVGKTIPEAYTFYLNDTISNSTGVFNMLEPGDYQIKVTASGGAPAKTVTVTVPDFYPLRPRTNITAMNPVCELPGSIRLEVVNGLLYNIKQGSSVYLGDHTFNNLSAGTYFFTILKKNGCIADTLSVTIALEACRPVNFPNTFTPNGDGINDIFIAKQNGAATQYHFSLFNRYGEQLFETRDLLTGWNGTFKGNAMPASTYYWMVSYIDDNNKKQLQKGFVTLVR